MKLRLDLLPTAILVASAGSELVAPDALSADQPTGPVCGQGGKADGTTPVEAEVRILAEGYSEVRILAKGCDNVWHALALAEGDPVIVRVTPQGVVLTE